MAFAFAVLVVLAPLGGVALLVGLAAGGGYFIAGVLGFSGGDTGFVPALYALLASAFGPRS